MDYRQLVTDGMPFTPTLLNNGDDSVDYRNQLNLALIITQAENQIATHLEVINNMMPSMPPNVQALNMTLETYLYTLFSVSTITSLDNTTLSTYFEKRKLVDPNYFTPVDPTYLANLTFTNYKPWGDKCGSLGFYLYINQSSTHYENPSTLVNTAFQYAVATISNSVYANSILNLLVSNDPKDDINIYNLSWTIIGQLQFDKVNGILTFLETWIPSLLSQYSTIIQNGTITNTYSPGTSQYTAFNLVVQIAQQLLQQGIASENLTDLAFSYYHQSMDTNLITAIQTLITLTKQNEFAITSTTPTAEESLCKSLFASIPISTEATILTTESYNILTTFPFVGGMNFWLTAVAAQLLNRAYILTYNTLTAYSNYYLSPLQQDPDFITFIGRIYTLIFYAGYCLKKTNLDHLQIIGANLRTLSQLDNDNTMQECNLLQ